MLLEGILLGLTLSLMIGPLLFAIVQTSLEEGFRAGVTVAAGMWSSDLLFVALSYFGASALASFTAWPHFTLWVGLLGGLLLVSFGLGILLKRPAKNPVLAVTRSAVPFHQYYLRGFLLNTVNPFTVFFWISIGGGVVAINRGQGQQITQFFLGMLLTIALSDVLKAWGAKHLRQWLTPPHIRRVQQGIGVLLIVFGLVLAGRSMG